MCVSDCIPRVSPCADLKFIKERLEVIDQHIVLDVGTARKRHCYRAAQPKSILFQKHVWWNDLPLFGRCILPTAIKLGSSVQAAHSSIPLCLEWSFPFFKGDNHRNGRFENGFREYLFTILKKVSKAAAYVPWYLQATYVMLHDGILFYAWVQNDHCVHCKKLSKPYPAVMLCQL